MYGCDDCQVACPPSTVSIRRGHLGAPLLIEPLSLIDILDMSDDQLLTQFGDWYIADRDPDLIRRNVLIGLGNSASEAQEIPVTLRHRYRNGPDAYFWQNMLAGPLSNDVLGVPHESLSHQRLPSKTRWHSVVLVGAVAKAASGGRDGADYSVCRT